MNIVYGFVKAVGHFCTILKHKFWVFYYCCIVGLVWQGIVHDLSKFSSIEFFESVRYWTGKSSPLEECRKRRGYSKAWLHHKGRNKHHYQYWTDNFDYGGTAVQMPFKYAVEMLCDFLAAGRAYSGKDFSFKREYEWWQSKKELNMLMHKQTFMFIDTIMEKLSDAQLGTENLILDKDNLKKVYTELEDLLKFEDVDK